MTSVISNPSGKAKLRVLLAIYGYLSDNISAKGPQKILKKPLDKNISVSYDI
jgi:hypothetical protein